MKKESYNRYTRVRIMKLWKRVRKRRVFGLFFILAVFLYSCLHSKNYEVEYDINDVYIKESYLKKKKLYTFLFQVEGQEFVSVFENKYLYDKQLVEEIEVKKKENILCIIPTSKKFSFTPLCKENGNLISYHLIQDRDVIPDNFYKDVAFSEEEYKNLKLYQLNNKKYFLWIYKGFDIIDSKEKQEISLFTNDVYSIPISLQVNDYILLADYSSKYEFSKFYVIDSKTNKIREVNLEEALSFDTYFLGAYEKKAYLVDKKKQKEYEIYPKRLLFSSITNNGKGKILVDGEFTSVSMLSLSNKEQIFTYDDWMTYLLEQETLYQKVFDYKIKVSNKKIKEIVWVDHDTVYYISEDSLYYYNLYEGEVLVMKNFEWNFNYKHMIFVF